MRRSWSNLVLTWTWFWRSFGRSGRRDAARWIQVGGDPSLPTSVLSALQGISFGSWNARALLHHDHSKKALKMRELASLLRTFKVLLVQEIHGSRHAFFRTIRPYKSHRAFYSPGVDTSTAGAAIFVHNDILGLSSAAPNFEEFIPGRLLKLSFDID
eukprot:11639418-Karenia_brevis.AAC.1